MSFVVPLDLFLRNEVHVTFEKLGAIWYVTLLIFMAEPLDWQRLIPRELHLSQPGMRSACGCCLDQRGNSFDWALFVHSCEALALPIAVFLVQVVNYQLCIVDLNQVSYADCVGAKIKSFL